MPKNHESSSSGSQSTSGSQQHAPPQTPHSREAAQTSQTPKARGLNEDTAERSSNDDGGGGGTHKPRRWPRRLGIGGGICLVLLVGLILLVPTLLSWGLGASLASSIGSDSIRGQLHVGAMNVGWFSGATLDDVTITDPEGKPVIKLDALEAPDISLLGLAGGGRDLGRVEIKNLHVNFKRYPSGSTNLSRSLGTGQGTAQPKAKAPRSKPSGPLKIPASLHARIKLDQALITVSAPNVQPARITLNGEAKANGRKSLAADFTASLSRAQTQGGTVKAKASVTDYTDGQGRVTLGALTKATLDARLNLSGLDLTMLDPLAGPGHLLSTFIGPTLQGRLVANGRVSKFISDISLKSKNLAASGGVVTKGGVITQKPNTGITFKISPPTWSVLMKMIGEARGGTWATHAASEGEADSPAPQSSFVLDQPTRLSLSLDKLHLDLGGAQPGSWKIKPGNVRANLKLALAKTRLTDRSTGEHFTIDGLGLNLSTKDVTNRVALKGQGKFYQTAPGRSKPETVGRLDLSTTALSLVDDQLKPTLEKAGLTTNVNLQLPTALLNVLNSLVQTPNPLGTKLAAALGPRMNIKLKVDRPEHGPTKARLRLDARAMSKGKAKAKAKSEREAMAKAKSKGKGKGENESEAKPKAEAQVPILAKDSTDGPGVDHLAADAAGRTNESASATHHTGDKTNLRFTADQTSRGKPFTWTLEGQSEPLQARVNTQGTFNRQQAVVTLKRLAANLSVSDARRSALVSLLPEKLAVKAKRHRVSLRARAQMKDGRIALTDPRASALELLFNVDRVEQ